MPDWLLNVDIVDGPVIWVFYALSAIGIIILLVRRPTPRRPTPRWAATALGALVAGILLALLTVWLIQDVFDVFGSPMSQTTFAWILGTFAAVCLALINLVRSRWRRKVVAIVSIAVFGVTATLGVNAGFGLNRTLGSFLGISTEPRIDANGPVIPPTPDPETPLYQSWNPPADMPAHGKTGTHVIPNTESGFTSRPAGIYLPPAALVKNAPSLPLVILMMGQPGLPDPQYVAPILDKLAAKHDGLAPIVVVADQLGDPSIDPLCLNTKKYGNAETFITEDVVNWAKSNLRVLHGRKYWTIAGYSNGGGCAAYFGAKYPEIWGNIGDLSGTEFAGDENEKETLADIFDGDQAAYDAIKPANIFAANTGEYADTIGVFTSGADDEFFSHAVTDDADAARSAGVSVTRYEVPGAGHGVKAVDGGLKKLFDVLYPRLGLSAPVS